MTTCPGLAGIKIYRKGKLFINNDGLSVAILNDPWGAWSNDYHNPEITNVVHISEMWNIESVHLAKKGPWRSTLLLH